MNKQTQSNIVFENIQREKLLHKQFFTQWLGATNYQIKHKKTHDAVITINKRVYKMEEKYRKGVWDDILIEILQNYCPDSVTYELGWFAFVDCELLLYVWCQCNGLNARFSENWEPVRCLLIKPWCDFKDFFARNERLFPIHVSDRGYGHTINRVVPLKVIPRSIITVYDLDCLLSDFAPVMNFTEGQQLTFFG